MWGCSVRGSAGVVRAECRARGAGLAGWWGGLFDDFGDAPGSDGAPTFTDREQQAVFHRDGFLQRDRHLGVVSRHDHLRAFRQTDRARHVSGPEVEPVSYTHLRAHETDSYLVC